VTSVTQSLSNGRYMTDVGTNVLPSTRHMCKLQHKVFAIYTSKYRQAENDTFSAQKLVLALHEVNLLS